MTDIESLWKFDLRRGPTDHPRNGACLYDAANWIVYGEIGDDPPCACPVIRAYAIRLNDTLPDDQRQRLKPFILRVVGNRDPESEAARAEYLVRQAVDVIVPMALEAAVLTKRATSPLTVLCGGASEGVALAVISAARATAARGDAAEAAVGGGRWFDAAAHAGRAVEAALDAAVLDCTARNRVYDAAIEALDGALRTGRQADPFDDGAVRRAVAAFECV